MALHALAQVLSLFLSSARARSLASRSEPGLVFVFSLSFFDALDEICGHQVQLITELPHGYRAPLSCSHLTDEKSIDLFTQRSQRYTRAKGAWLRCFFLNDSSYLSRQ